MSTKILVLGSKYDVKLPDLKFEKIYTANGAANLVNSFKNRYNNIHHTSVFGTQEFLKNIHVQKSIISSNPDSIVTRNGFIEINKYNFSNLRSYQKLNSFNDLKLQLEFLDLNILNFFFYELKYNEKNKIKYLLRCLKKLYFQGFSTGIFSILLALKENPFSNVLFSGIGLSEGGGHFYTSKDDKGFFSNLDLRKNIENNFRNTNRKRVEKILFDKICTKYKKRLITTDYELSITAKIAYFDCKKFISFTRNVD